MAGEQETIGVTESAFYTNPTQPMEPVTQWTVQYTLLTLCAVTVFANPLTLAALVKGRLVMKSSINVCITSLCCSDLMFGLTTFLLYLPFSSPELAVDDSRLRKVRFGVAVFSLQAFMMSTINCFLITLDRTIATLTPLEYKTKMTAEKISKVLMVLWLSTAVFSILTSATKVLMHREYGVLYFSAELLPESVANYVVVPGVIVGLLTNAVLYVVIVRSLAKFAHRIRLQTTPLYEKRTTRITRMVTLVVGVMMLGNLPILITAAMPCPSFCPTSYMLSYRTAYDVCMAIAVVPTFVNNVIYFGRIADFKKCFFTLICCKIETASVNPCKPLQPARNDTPLKTTKTPNSSSSASTKF